MSKWGGGQSPLHNKLYWRPLELRFAHGGATSHTRLIARDHYTSSTLIGGKGGASPSSLHSSHYTWETNRVCECKMDVKSTWILTWHHMDHVFMVTWTISLKPPLGDRPNTKPGDHGTPNSHNRLFTLFYHVWGPSWISIHWNGIWWRAWSHMTIGFSQFHGHGSLACVWSGPYAGSIGATYANWKWW